MAKNVSNRTYATQWDHQCLVLTQNVDLWIGSKVAGFSENFIAANTIKQPILSHKKRDILSKDTNFEVVRVYDKYFSDTRSYWHLRVNLKVLNGKYKGMEVEIPGIYSAHPSPMFFTHKTQAIPYTARENLQPNSIEFNPEFLTECAK